MMTNTETKKVKIIPKQPRFISDILQLPARIDEEMQLELNVREIIRCMQFADVYDEEDTLLTPENFADIVESSEDDGDEDETESGQEDNGEEVTDDQEEIEP